MPPNSRPRKSTAAKRSTPAVSPRLATSSNHQTDHSRRPGGVVKKTSSSSQQQSAPTRRAQVRHACLHCRTDKVKCSGTHPICTRCTARSLACSWDVPEEGITKTQHLQHKLAEQSARLDQVNAMVHILRHGTDKVATEALARLRIGETVDEVLELVGTQDLSMSMPDQMQPGQMEPGPGSWSSNEPAYDPMLVPPNHYAAARERLSA